MSHLDLSCFPGLSADVCGEGAKLAPRVADLAHTYPLLFYMLATDTGAFARRVDVLSLIEAGKPLSEVAAAFGLPLCFRRIPPQACREALPWVAWSPDAALVLANHIPETASATANWLALVFTAARYCNVAFAIWIARQSVLFAGERVDPAILRPLAMYAWHSMAGEHALKAITTTPWIQDFGLNRALDEADAWLLRLLFLAHSGHYPIQETWLPAARLGLIEILPIVTWDQLMEERAALNNCLHAYAERIASGGCRIFVVKEGGKTVAAVEILLERRRKMMLGQVRGPGNQAPSRRVLAAVKSWFRQHANEAAAISPMGDARHALSRILELTMPYRSATGTSDTMASLAVDVMRAKISQLRQLHMDRKREAAHQQTRPQWADNVLQSILTADRVREALRARLGHDVYQSWFSLMTFHHREAGVVCASVPVRFLRSWIQGHYREELRNACAIEWPDVMEVDILVRPAPVRPAQICEERRRVQMAAPPQGVEGPRPGIPVQDIVTAVSRQYGVTPEDLLSDRRHRDVVAPRQIAIYLAHLMSSRNHAEIGRRFGNRDRATIRNAVRKVRAAIEERPDLGAEIEALRNALLAQHGLRRGHP